MSCGRVSSRSTTSLDITAEGRAALSAWLDEPPAPRISEFEAMLKIFFADAGDMTQLEATLDAVQESARDRLHELTDMVEAISAHADFPERLHISALSLRLQFAQEAAVLTWSRWARDEVRQWRSTTDPARWNTRAALASLASDIDDVLLATT